MMSEIRKNKKNFVRQGREKKCGGIHRALEKQETVTHREAE